MHTPLSFVLLAEAVAIIIGLAAGVLPARRARPRSGGGAACGVSGRRSTCTAIAPRNQFFGALGNGCGVCCAAALRPASLLIFSRRREPCLHLRGTLMSGAITARAADEPTPPSALVATAAGKASFYRWIAAGRGCDSGRLTHNIRIHMIHWFIAAPVAPRHARRFLGDAPSPPVPGGIAVIELGMAGDAGPTHPSTICRKPVIRHKDKVGGAGRAAARCRRGDLR